MGGCCCSSRRTEPNILPAYYYFPRVPEEQVPLSTHHAGGSGISAGFVVNPVLETSTPDTIQPSPAFVSHVVDSGTLLTASRARETPNTKTDRAVQPIGGGYDREANAPSSFGGANAADSQGSIDKEFEEANGADSDSVQTAPIDIETELKKSSELISFVVEECPTCLEEYDEENPKMVTKCGHQFHLPCILEWMERSDRCPVCDQEMGIDEMFEDCMI